MSADPEALTEPTSAKAALEEIQADGASVAYQVGLGYPIAYLCLAVDRELPWMERTSRSACTATRSVGVSAVGV